MKRTGLLWIATLVIGCSNGTTGVHNNGGSGGTGGGGGSVGGVGGDDLATGGGLTDGGTADLAGGGGSDGGGGGGAPNITPMIIDNGPPGTGSVDVPFVSITICAPGTSNCQTIDHVSVDTGSSGIRIIASVLNAGIVLPAAKASNGNPLTECLTFADGYSWGSVKQADIKLGGESASGMLIHLIGDPAFTTVPSDCSSSGPSENTVADFGGNGIIGINQIVADDGLYYSCSGATCTSITVPAANQVPNPIPSFKTDNNGAILRFADVPAGGAVSLSGQLVFGIGTQSNNALGSATVLTVDSVGNFTTTYKNTTFATSFIDSGSNSYAFNDTSIAQCKSMQSSGFFCPTTPLSLMATNTGRNNITSMVSLSVANTDTLFANTTFSVFDNLAGPGIDSKSFDWGLPFFLGRNVYVAVDGASTPGGNGPYFAY